MIDLIQKYPNQWVAVHSGRVLAADPDRAWRLEVMAGNKTMLGKLITGAPGTGLQWQTIEVPLDEFAGKQTVLRLFQRVLLVPAANTGNAYWRELKLQ